MLNKLKIKRLTETAKLPTKGYFKDSGFDVFYDGDVEIQIQPGCRRLIPTGIAIQLPSDIVYIDGQPFVYEAQVRPRSGLAIKQGLGICNSPGTIDC